MSTRAGVGMSRHHNPNVAGREAAEQALQKAGISKPDFVFMFGSIGYDQRSLVRAVRETTRGAPLTGCSAEGTIDGDDADESGFSVVVTAISSGELTSTSIIGRRQLTNIATTRSSLMGSPTRCSQARRRLVGL